jgi:MFS family permease
MNRSQLPILSQVTKVHATHMSLYLLLLTTALLFGFMEVLRDNTAQTLMPSVVEEKSLEKANGRMWAAESLANTFIGPPLGSLLLGVSMAFPFYFDAGSFFFCAGLVGTLVGGFRAVDSQTPRATFRADIKEGVRWLWKNDLLRRMAIILGLLNFASSLFAASYILYAQEVLHTSVFVFAILGTAGAVGGIVGGTYGPRLSAKIGSGPSVALALIGLPLFTLLIGLASSWRIVWALTAFETFLSVLWNVVTVSLRQSIIPPVLLGRVNSVYRSFAWGTMPIASLIGGFFVTMNLHFMSREWALRSTFILAAVVGAAIACYAVPILTTARIEDARNTPRE